jgi:hypothetical protein
MDVVTRKIIPVPAKNRTSVLHVEASQFSDSFRYGPVNFSVEGKEIFSSAQRQDRSKIVCRTSSAISLNFLLDVVDGVGSSET